MEKADVQGGTKDWEDFTPHKECLHIDIILCIINSLGCDLSGLVSLSHATFMSRKAYLFTIPKFII
jgi:hypothetical protein